MILHDLLKKELIHPPKWLPDNTMYLTLMGSVAYGCSSDTSDVDIYGFAIPDKGSVFPHTLGEIQGFGTPVQRFEQWSEHHVDDKSARKMYDFTIFSIVKYFHLVMQNNPNALDSLFTPQNCVIHMTHVGNIMRENRRMFLHKGCWPRLKGYAYSQLHKASTKNPEAGSKRSELREQFGMDVKFMYHVVRLLYEAEMILTEGDLDLQRHREHLKSIRRGEISEADIRLWAAEKEKQLEAVYSASTLQHGPDEAKIKALLLQCLEAHYGSLDKLGYINPDAAETALQEIEEIISKYRKSIGA